MVVAEYYTKPCSACDEVEGEVLNRIAMRYHLKRYDIDEDADHRHLEVWRKRTKGEVPALRLVGDERVVWFKGVESLKALARECAEWVGKSGVAMRLHPPITKFINLKVKQKKEE